jgi:hypothetical protein
MNRYYIVPIVAFFLISVMAQAACTGTSSSDSDDDGQEWGDDDDDDEDECILCEDMTECVDALGQGWMCLDKCCVPIGDDDTLNDDVNDDADDDVDDDTLNDDADDDADDDIDDDADDDADDDIDDDVNDDADDDIDDDLQEEELRIILVWGAFPSDLDLHMWAPHTGCEVQNPFHLFYPDSGVHGHGCWEDFALELDDVSGNGPEIIGIYDPIPNEEFRLLVHDYSDISCNPWDCDNMSNSDGLSVRVRSYDDSWEFTMPPDTHANLWHVFNAVYNGDRWVVWGVNDYCFGPSSSNVYGCDE